MKNDTSAAARALRSIPSEARTAASRENGKRGGRPAATYYARLWNCGRGTRRANTGQYQFVIYAFESRAARDAACDEYRPPNHCPTAALEPVKSSDPDVRRELRSEFGVTRWEDR